MTLVTLALKAIGQVWLGLRMGWTWQARTPQH